MYLSRFNTFHNIRFISYKRPAIWENQGGRFGWRKIRRKYVYDNGEQNGLPVRGNQGHTLPSGVPVSSSEAVLGGQGNSGQGTRGHNQ